MVAIGYLVGFRLLAANILVTFWNLQTIRRTWRAHCLTGEVIGGLDTLFSNLTDAETGQRGYILTGVEAYLQPFRDARARLDASVQRFIALTKKGGQTDERVRAIAELTAAKLAELEQTIQLRRENGFEPAVELVKTGRSKALMDELRAAITAMEADEYHARDQGKAELEKQMGFTLLTFLGNSLLVLVLLLAIQSLDRKARQELKARARCLGTTLSSIGDAVIATDGEGRLSFMNPVAEMLTGWNLDSAIGRDLAEVFHISNEETREPAENPVSRVLREGKVVGLANHTVLTAKDGTIRPIEDSAAPIKQDQLIQGVVLVFRDASQTRAAQLRIRESEERYRSIVAATTHTVWVSSPDFSSTVPLAGNDPIEWSDGDAKPGGWLDAVHPEDRERTRQAFLGAVRAKSVYEAEHRIKSRDGTYRHYLARAIPLLDQGGNIREWIGTSNDITERREAEEAREQLYEKLRENDKQKDEFLAMLAHELRNPLAAISGAVALSTLTGLQEHINWSMEVISRQVKHLTRLIDDLLDVSRISRGKIQLRCTVLDATSILDSAVETVRPLINQRRHELEVAIERGSLWVSADPTRLEQVVTNLLVNAAKYTKDGGRIWVEAGHEAGDVLITVRDTGIGIPPEKLSGMFELFAQGDRSPDRSEGGLGIGLTVVQRLVELHGGTVSASSEGTNKGCQFTVRLPAARQPARIRPESSGEAAARPVRVLVVDDNVDTAQGLAMTLRLLGYEASTALDGKEALEVARALRPEVILLDIGLPGMDGYEIATRLRNEELCQAAKIIAITGYGQEEDRHRSVEAGFDDYLVKPIDHQSLLNILSKTLIRC
jgi:PAS domain S-box-containing protein